MLRLHFSLAVLVVLILFVCSVNAQFLNNSTATPVPGSDRDYIKLLAETVDPASGSLSVRASVPVPKGRGGLALPFSFAYDSGSALYPSDRALWTTAQATITPFLTNGGWGYTLPQDTFRKTIVSFPRGGSCTYFDAYIFQDTNGARHALPLGFSSAGYPANCNPSVPTGTDHVYSAEYGRYVDPSGTVYTMGAIAGLPQTRPVSAIEDRNGNIITVASQYGVGGGSFSVTDTVGRTLVSASGFGQTGNSVTVAGLAAPYSVTWQTASVNLTVTATLLPNSGIGCIFPTTFSKTGIPVVTAITLPNTHTYTFQYDSTYGLVSKVTYPSGGYVRYSWGLNSNAAMAAIPDYQYTGVCYYKYDKPSILHRYVSFDGTHIALQQDFSYSTTWSSNPIQNGWSSKQTTVTTHDLIRDKTFTTTYTYVGVPAPLPVYTFSSYNDDAEIPQESQVVYKDWDGSVLKTVAKTWYDLFVVQNESVTLGSNGPTSNVSYQYGPGDQVTEKDEYDFGGALLRKTVTNYQSFAATPIFPSGPSIFDQPSSVITYDGSNTPVAETDYFYDQTAVSPVSAFGHDETNYSASYNNRANLSTQTVKCLQSGCTNAVTTFVHDETGQTTSITDPNGNPTQYSYSDNYLAGSGTPPGNTNAYPTTVTHPTVGSVTAHDYFQYAYSDGQLTASQDDNDKTANKSTSYSYVDSLRRLTETDYPDGGYVRLSYNDALYTPSVTKTVLIDNTVSPNWTEVTTTTMDGLGHPTESKLTSDPDGTETTDTTYDGLGAVYTQSNPYRSTSDKTYGVTTNSYDALGRATSIVKPDGSVLTTSYSGNCATVVDEIGNSRKSCTDGLGRLTQVSEAPNVLNYETDYQYDALNNLLCAVQRGTDSSQFTTCAAAPASWRPRSFTYDSLSHLTSTTNPESGTISYSYDANGNVLKKTSPKPNQTNPASTGTVNYCYDALNRITSKSYNNTACNPPTSPVATYTYDQGTNAIGYRTGMTEPTNSGSSSWTYYVMGRVNTETRVTSNVTKNTSYTYNQAGAIKSIAYPSGRILNYSYGPSGSSLSAGRPLSVIDSTGPINYLTSATYAPQGTISTYTNGFVSGGFTGITTANTYNSRLQPVLLSAASPTATILSLCYDFHSKVSINQPPCAFSASTAGNNGNVFQIVNNRDSNRTQNFTYDNLNRIQQAYSSGTMWGETFGSQAAPGGVPSTAGIDAWGNLWQRSPVTGKTNYELLSVSVSNNNQLSGFGYDAAGNMTSNGSATYQYNQEDQLTKFITTTTDIYVYDGDGRRVKKNIGAVTLYWYDTGGNVIDETNGSGALTAEYVYFNGKRVARRDSSSNIHYYFSDHLGSSSVVTDAAGTMSLCPLANSPMNYTTIPTGEEESDFYPYGGEMLLCDRALQHYKFTGKERDSESGLDNFGARYFASSLGRFMRPDDPLADQHSDDPQSWNLYSYVHNDPLSFTDPSGNACELNAATQTWETTNNPGESCEQVDINNTTNLTPSAQVTSTPIDTLADIPANNLANGVANLTTTSSLSEVGVNGILGAQTAEGIWNLPSLYRGGADLIASWRMASKMASVRAAGQTGEALANIVKNTERIPSLTGTAAYRVPDILDSSAKVIGEVKNYNGTLSLTAQIKDDIAFAQQNGYTMVLRISQSTQLSRPLQQLVNQGTIQLIKF